MANQPKVAYVHSEYLFENQLGTIESYKALESKTEKWGNNLDSLSTSYRAVFAPYKEGGESLEKEKKEQLEHQLKRKQDLFTTYHQSVEKMKGEEDQKLTQAVVKQMDAYLKEYAKNQGYDMIFAAGTTSSLVHADKFYDVTDEVLLYINKKYKGGK